VFGLEVKDKPSINILLDDLALFEVIS